MAAKDYSVVDKVTIDHPLLHHCTLKLHLFACKYSSLCAASDKQTNKKKSTSLLIHSVTPTHLSILHKNIKVDLTFPVQFI